MPSRICQLALVEPMEFSVPKDEPVLSAVALGLGSSTPKRRPGYLWRPSC